MAGINKLEAKYHKKFIDHFLTFKPRINQMCFRLKIILYCLLQIYTLAEGQQYFDKLVVSDGIQNQSRIIAEFVDSNNIYVIGDLMDSIIDPLNPQVRPWFGVINFHGDLTIKKTLFIEELSQPIGVSGNQLVKLSNGKLMYYADYYDTDGWTDGIVLIIDPNTGSITDYEIIQAPVELSNFISPSWFALDETGNIYLSNTVFVENIPRTLIIILKSDLTITKQILVDVNSRNNYVDYIEAGPDGALHIIGESRRRNDNSDFPEVKPYYMQVDTLGKILTFNLASGVTDKTVYQNPSHFNVAKDEVGNWIITRATLTKNTNCLNCFTSIPIVYSLSSSFDSLIWTVRLGENIENDSQVNFIYSGAMDLSNKYLIISGVNDKYHYEGSYISKISANGDSLWTRKFKPIIWQDENIAWSIIRDISFTPFGSIVGVGSASRIGEALWRSWIIHIDSFGCLIPGCNIPSDASIDISDDENLFKIYPNPAQSYFAIVLNSSAESEYYFQFLSVDGKLVNSANSIISPGVQYVFNCSNLVSGIYILNIYHNNKLAHSMQIPLNVTPSFRRM